MASYDLLRKHDSTPQHTNFGCFVCACCYFRIFCLTLYDPGGGGELLKPPLQNFAITHLILGLHYCALVTFSIKLFYTVLRKKILIRGQGLAVKGGIKI